MKKLNLRSKMILTVHDSVLFDVTNKEMETLCKLCYDVGNDLGQYVKNYYNIPWDVKLECEVEAGPSYGDIKFVPPKGE